MAVDLAARTTRTLHSCPLEVQTEAWVEGVGNAETQRDDISAEVRTIRFVPRAGRWTSTSKHWLIWNYGLDWDFLGTEFGETFVVVEQDSSQEELCIQQGGQWNGRLRVCTYTSSPIIADMDGDGYRLTSVEEGVWFDLDGDGSSEQLGWTAAGSDDAFLVLDRNGNGRIDDGTELFGDHTPAYADQPFPPVANGFEALKFAEGPSYGGGRADGTIDSADAIFHRLLLWRDANHNGVSERDELQPVRDSALLAIGTDYQAARRKDMHGNEFRLRAKSWWQKPSGTMVDRFLYDVWLNTR
jgi:hypothetical protein